MIGALAYLQFHSVKNRLVQRVKRLKQPKYLLGAIVGGAYFYFYFFHFLFGGRGRMGSAGMPGVPPDPLLYESIGALLLFCVLFLRWIIPRERAALSFTEAEVAFLFPAPISRRGLIQFKLLRSQLGILVTVLFFTLISTRFGRSGNFLIRAAGWWIILFTLNLHFIGASFALTMLMDRGLANWKRRVILFGLAVVALIGVLVWAVQAIPELRTADLADPGAMVKYFKQVLVSGPLPYLLYPFRLVVRPYLASDWLAFVSALWPALVLMALHYLWVVRADVEFEEASVESSRRLAERMAAARSGNYRGSGNQPRPKRDPFFLSSRGPAPVALLWKNLISAGSSFNKRTAIVLIVSVAFMAMALRNSAENSNWVHLLSAFSAGLAVWALLIGPQLVRQDFRQDLPNMDLLKAFPLGGWQIVTGELLAPAVILTVIHWVLLLVAVICAGEVAEGYLTRGVLIAIGLGAAIVLPVLNLISLLIPNAAVLLFPAWFQAGRQGAAGIEATGQRLIFALGQFLAFLFSLLPAGAALGVVFFLGRGVIGDAPAVILAALAAAVVLAAEAAVGVVWLGRLFERFDVSAEQLN